MHYAKLLAFLFFFFLFISQQYFFFLVMNLLTRKLILLDQLTSPLMTICTDKLLLQTDMVKKKPIATTVQPKGLSIVLRDIWVACF